MSVNGWPYGSKFPDRELSISKREIMVKLKHSSVMIFEVLKLLTFAKPSLTYFQSFKLTGFCVNS